jgi:hypothetical protein
MNQSLIIGKLEVVKIGCDKMSQLGSKMVLHKNKIYVSSHGTNIFSGSIYILNDNRYIYPNFNMNQCWGFNMVSNGVYLAISAHCHKMYTGYVQLYPSRKILMNGEYIGDNCGFHVAWFDNKWWVSCSFKIWNSDIGFIRQSIDRFPMFIISYNKFITLQYVVKSRLKTTLYYDTDEGYYYDSLLLPVNIIRHEYEENQFIYGCRQEEVYMSLFYNNTNSYCTNKKDRYYGTSLYKINKINIIGSNQSIILDNYTIQIPSFQNTTFSYSYIAPFLYIGSYSSLNFTGVIYRLNITFFDNSLHYPSPSPTQFIPITTLSLDMAKTYQAVLYWIFVIVACFYITFTIIVFIYICFIINTNNSSNFLIKKKTDKYGLDEIDRPGYEYQDGINEIQVSTPIELRYMENERHYKIEDNNKEKDKDKEIEKEKYITPNLPGAYHIYT